MKGFRARLMSNLIDGELISKSEIYRVQTIGNSEYRYRSSEIVNMKIAKNCVSNLKIWMYFDISMFKSASSRKSIKLRY